MAIRRPPIPADGYVIVSNGWVRDPRLSWKAKGLLVYISSHQVNHQLTTDQILAEGADGRDSVRAGLTELERAGYLRRTVHRSTDGKVSGTDYELTDPTAEPLREIRSGRDQHEQPVSAAHCQCGKSGAGKAAGKKTSPKKTKEEDLSGASAPAPSTEAPGNTTAQTILASYIDWLAAPERQIILSRQVIGRYGRAIKELLESGFTPDLVKRGLARQQERGRAGWPSQLHNYVVEAQNRPVSAPPAQFKTGAERRAEADQARLARAALADQIMAQTGCSADDALRLAGERLSSIPLENRSVTSYIEGEIVKGGHDEVVRG